MKVLQINTVCGYGSTGRIAVDIAHMLEENGHACRILFGRGSTPAGVDCRRVGNNLLVNLHGVASRITDRQGFYSKTTSRRLIAEAQAYDPDVIHLHNVHGYYLYLPMLFEWLAVCGKPVVWTLHDCWTFTGHCAHFANVNCQKWKTGCGRCPLKGSYPASLVMDHSKKNYQQKRAMFTSLPSACLVTPSQWLASLVKESYMGRFPVEVIANGINTAAFSPQADEAVQALRAKHGLEGQRIYLGVAGVWTPQKDLGDLKEMASHLREDERLVVIGLTPSQAADMPKKILGLTRTENLAALAAWYTLADVLVNPTWEDTFPTVNLEAMACGTPVAAYRTGGCPEQIVPSVGRIVEQRDVEGLLQAARELRKEQDGLSENCRAHVEAHYDARRQIARYIDLYRRVGAP